MPNWRFGAFPKLPYSTMQQLNLDWILDRIRRFLPDNGTKGQVLTRTKDGAAWVDPEAASGAVSSVNGKTGAVVLTASDVGALPSSYQAPVTSVNGMTGDVVISGGGAVDSVNGKTGEVVLTAADVGALPESYVPPAAPVQSVNGQTGAVQLAIPEIDDNNVSPSDTWSSQKIRDFIYPIGSIYMSVNSTSPATIFGGTWEQLEDRFLLGAGSAYAAGSSGGAATHNHTTGSHKLTVNEMPSHSHKYTDYYNVPNGSTYKAVAFNLAADPTGLSVQATGGNAAHSHGNTGTASSLPPYLAVYIWKRTA